MGLFVLELLQVGSGGGGGEMEAADDGGQGVAMFVSISSGNGDGLTPGTPWLSCIALR